MTHDTLELLRLNHPAWRLLASTNATLVASFLHSVFISRRVHGLSQSDLTSRLTDVLYRLNVTGESPYPRSAAEYLDQWAHDSTGWLRKFYPSDADEPHFDLTPATEKALSWLEGLSQASFVGTESRLLTVFELLRQLVLGSSADPEIRLRDLERRRTELDREILAVKSGVTTTFDAVEVRDRFQQAAATARELLSDFRQVEQNFRTLDRQTREKIALWSGTKGDLVGDILGEREAIAESDQGRSFRAFWDFLMDPARQEELGQLWESASALAAVQEMNPDPRLKRIHFDWLGAGDHAQRTVALLSAQLRRFLDDRVWLENRRIAEILHGIELNALEIRNNLPTGLFFDIDDVVPSVDIPLERPLYSPPFHADLRTEVSAGSGAEVDAGLLFDQVLVDPQRLENWLDHALDDRKQVTLGSLIEAHPLDQGLAELVTWLGVAHERPETVFDDEASDTLAWTDPLGRRRIATGARIIFTRKEASHES